MPLAPLVLERVWAGPLHLVGASVLKVGLLQSMGNCYPLNCVLFCAPGQVNLHFWPHWYPLYCRTAFGGGDPSIIMYLAISVWSSYLLLCRRCSSGLQSFLRTCHSGHLGGSDSGSLYAAIFIPLPQQILLLDPPFLQVEGVSLKFLISNTAILSFPCFVLCSSQKWGAIRRALGRAQEQLHPRRGATLTEVVGIGDREEVVILFFFFNPLRIANSLIKKNCLLLT